MSGLKSKTPSAVQPRDPGCLQTQEVPPICLRLHSQRQRLAIPYALLLRVELSDDETCCLIVFATHEISVRGRRLKGVYIAVSQGLAAHVGIGDAANLSEGDCILGPLVTDIRISPVDEAVRARQ